MSGWRIVYDPWVALPKPLIRPWADIYIHKRHFIWLDFGFLKMAWRIYSKDWQEKLKP